MRQKISYARFHTGVFIPNVGNLGDVLPPPSKRLGELLMFYTPHGLEVSMLDNKGKTTTMLIPPGNVALAQYAAEEKK